MERVREAEEALDAGARPLWLLTLTLPDGRAVHASTRPVVVESRSEAPRAFEPFLVGVEEFEEELDVFSLDGVGALTQARVDVGTPGIELGALQGDWHHVTAAKAELAIAWPGQLWEDRLVVLDGDIAGVDFGVAGQATTLALETTPPPTSAAIGDDTRDVGDAWPEPVDVAAAELSDLSGRKHIFVYGACESVPAYKVGEVATGTNRLALCGHTLPRTGSSYQVEVYEDGVSLGLFTPSNGTDPAGGAYAYVDDAAGLTFTAESGAFTWKATYGGIASAAGVDRPALNADGVLRRLLSDSGLRVDWRRTEPALARLRDWRVGLFLDQEASAIEVLRDRLLPFLPIVEMSGGEGIWIAYADPHLAPIEFELELGQDLLGRVGRMTTSDLDDIRNQFTVNYAPEAFKGVFTATARLDASTSALCALSQQLYGVRADEPIDCDVTWDPATAARVAAARAWRRALPRRKLTYVVAPHAYRLRAGMVGLVTDPDYGIARQRAVCTRANRTMLPFEATFELLDRTPNSRTG